MMTRTQAATEFVLAMDRAAGRARPPNWCARLEEEAGWPGTPVLPPILEELRASRDLPDGERKFLLYTLSAGRGGAKPWPGAPPRIQEHQSSLDDLFGRSRQFRRSQKFAEAVEFVAKFREYSPFNNMLVLFAESAGDLLRHRQSLAQGLWPHDQGGSARHDYSGPAHARAAGL